MSKLSKSKNNNGTFEGLDLNDLYGRCIKALESDYTVVAVDAKTLKEILEKDCNFTEKWNKRMDELGAERGNLNDLRSI